MSEPMLNVPESLFSAMSQDMESAIKPFDVRLLLLLLPDLLKTTEPVRVNLSYYAGILKRPAPQVSRSMTNLVKVGYLTRHSRDKLSYTYTLNASFLTGLYTFDEASIQALKEAAKASHVVYGATSSPVV